RQEKHIRFRDPGRIPELHRQIAIHIKDREHCPAVGGKGDGRTLSLPVEHRLSLSGRCVPQPHTTIIAARDQGLAVQGKGHAPGPPFGCASQPDRSCSVDASQSFTHPVRKGGDASPSIVTRVLPSGANAASATYLPWKPWNSFRTRPVDTS